MMLKSYLALLPLLAPLTTAVGTARVINNCNFSVFLWSMGDNADGPYQLDNTGTYSEPYGVKSDGSGKALALSLTNDGIFTSQPTLTFAYALTNGQVWYNLSEDYGQPFDQTLVQVPSDTSCTSNVWDGGVAPSGSQVQVCEQDTDVTLTLCAA
jgi:hypothetical protein